VLFFDQYAAANACFMLTTIFIFAKITQLTVESHSSTVDRLLFTFVLFGIFGICIVESIRGVNRWAESKREHRFGISVCMGAADVRFVPLTGIDQATGTTRYWTSIR
jgi:hypothetical protein